MQQRLEQATYNENKRRELLTQLELKHNEEQILVSVIYTYLHTTSVIIYLQQKELYSKYAVQYGFNKASPVRKVTQHYIVKLYN